MKICTGSHQLTADIDQLLAEVTLSVKFVSNLTGKLKYATKSSFTLYLGNHVNFTSSLLSLSIMNSVLNITQIHNRSSSS